MSEINIDEISEKIKNLGAVGINNFLDNKKLELITGILKDVRNEGITKSNHKGVYPVNLKNFFVKLLKFDFSKIKKALALKSIAKDLQLEKIAEKVLNQKTDLHMIDSYYNAKSDKNIIDWHCDIADFATDPKKASSVSINDGSIKFFIYLSNAESANGCLGYIPNSHHVVKAFSSLILEKKIDYKPFWRLEDLRAQVVNISIKDLIIKKIGEKKLNIFLDNSRFIEDHPKDTFKFDFEMNKGSIVIFDEFGFHRGAMPSKNSRLVLRFFYRRKVR